MPHCMDIARAIVTITYGDKLNFVGSAIGLTLQSLNVKRPEALAATVAIVPVIDSADADASRVAINPAALTTRPLPAKRSALGGTT